MGLGHSPSIVVDGLVFYIDPNNTNCYSGSGNTIYNLVNPSIGGTFVGYTSNPIDNTENRSLVYNGSTTYQEFYPIEPTRLTVSVWFKATGAPSLNDIYGGAILASSPQYYISYGMLYRWTTNTVLFVQSQNGEIISANAPANKYVNAVYTYDGTNTRLYIDGVLASTVSYTTDPQYFGSGNRNLQLGRWGYPGYERYFNGIIGQTLIYNRALSAIEILQNYNAKKKKYDPDENIVTNGLVLHIDPSKNTSYPGTGNTIYDLSGSGNTGTLVSSPTFSSFNSGSLVFNGNSYITRSSALNTGQNFSVTAWIYPTALSQRNAIVGNGYPYSTDSGWLFNICNNNFSLYQALMMSIGQDNVLIISNSYVFQLNKWSHIACSVSGGGSSVKFYVNGVETSYGFTSGSGRTISYASNEFHVGMRHSSTAERFAGNISGVQIYNKTLSAQEIQQNYNATKNRFVNALPSVRNGLVLELDAGQRASYPGTGNTWYDLSGNSLNGTLTNGPTFSGIAATSSLVFDRTNDHILIADNSLLNTFTGMTLEVIVKYTTTNDQIFAQKVNYATGNGYTLELFSSGIAAFCYGSGSSYLNVAVSSYPANNIYHMLFTLSGNTQTLYINGVSVATNSGGSLPSLSGTVFKIGDRTGTFATSAYLGGNVYLTKFYNRALTAAEVLQNFNFYRTRYGI
jgi:hypothetical protein